MAGKVIDDVEGKFRGAFSSPKVKLIFKSWYVIYRYLSKGK